MQILKHLQIERKISRLAVEILEKNFEANEIFLAGINNNGLEMARLLMIELSERTEIPLTLTRIRVNPVMPTANPIELEIPIDTLKNKIIIVVDDVANTGRTLFYALKPLMETLPQKIEIAVLVDRKHKSFPIQPDYVGLSLATTIQENIEVKLRDVEQYAVFIS
jgi:pyrimidine operon attenuation protein / uracil phosphoribosyltransferase